MQNKRKILSRGKTETGKWVYGDLVHYVDKLVIREVGDYWVKSETVGQFTGLSDKNGKKIFEGDILKVPNRDCYGRVEYSVPECRFEISMQNGYYVPMHDFASDVEIIGNIYDNPELFKGGEG